MFPGLHPAAASMVPPLGMGMAFNTAGLHHQPHVRLSAPSAAFLSGYYPQAAAAVAAAGASPFNGVQMSPNKVGPGSGVAPTNAGPPNNHSAPVQSYGLVSAQDATNMASSLNNAAAHVISATSSKCLKLATVLFI